MTIITHPIRPLLLTLVLLLVPVGCAQQRPPARVSTAPAALITLRTQLAIINARAAALATLRATGSLTLDYRGKLGNKHEYTAHGTLLVDQTGALQDLHHTTVPEMLLLGTYLGQDAFELGMNTTHFWMVDHQNKRAWVGRQALRHRLPPGAMPLHPGRVLGLMGITGLYQNATQQVTMTTSLHTGLNRIYVIRRGPNGHTWMRRILFFNRRTNHIIAVIMFDRAGRKVAAASLQDYRPIAARGQKPTTTAPQVPFHIEIWYPAGHARLSFTLDHASLTLRVPPRFAFALPRLSGMKVVRLDALARGQFSP